jgi:hypothetical protein
MNNLLNFFEELSEALLNPEKVIDLLNKNLTLKPWQEDYLNDLSEIWNSYKIYLSKISMSDPVFIDPGRDLSLTSLQSFSNLIFIDKICFSQLDKLIIDFLNKNNIKTDLYLQINQDNFDLKNLSLKEVSLDLINPELFTLYESKNAFGMQRQLLDTVKTGKISAIIDFDLQNKNFYNSLNPEFFNLKETFTFNKSPVYRFLTQLNNLLCDIITENNRHKNLIPLYSLFHFLTAPEVFKVLSFDINEKSLCALNMLFQELNQKSFLYLDLEGEFLIIQEDHINKYELMDLFEKTLLFLNNFLQIKSFDQMLDYLKNFSQNNMATLFYESELKSDEFEVYLEALVNLQSLSDLNLISDFKTLFPNSQNISASMLSFIIEFLRAKKISQDRTEIAQSKINIFDFETQDALSETDIAILNLQEGILPSVREIPFILNETQKIALGLQSFDSKKLLEKYRFYSLLKNNNDVSLFYIQNQDENTQKSSYLEELILNHNLEPNPLDDIEYLDFYSNRLEISDKPVPDKKLLKELDFFILPFDQENDLKDKSLDLSYYSWAKLKNDSFSWLLEQKYGLSNFSSLEKPGLSPLVLGNITHQVVEKLINDSAFLILDNETLFYQKTEDFFWQLMSDPKDYYYKIPYNFDGKFFNLFLMKYLKLMIFKFFYTTAKTLKSDHPAWYAEKYFSCEKSALANDTVLNIHLKSRVDLLIRDENRFLLFDFKTGNSSKEQLEFYRMIWLYCNSELDWEAFYARTNNLINDKRMDLSWLSNSDEAINNADKFFAKIEDVLQNLLKNQCCPSLKIQKGNYYYQVIRINEFKHLLSEKGLI